MAAVVFLDANVLYPAMLRDLLVQLGLAELIEPRWSDAIHDEWIRALLRTRGDIAPSQLYRTRALMDEALPRANVGSVTVTDTVAQLPDPNDRHVVAGAIAGSASLILTFNLKDFPVDALAPHHMVAVHPDPFLTFLMEAAPATFCGAVFTVRTRLRRAVSVQAYLASLVQIGLPKLADALGAHSDDI